MKKNNSWGYDNKIKMPFKHFLVIMRTTFILLFTVILCSYSATGKSQNSRVTLNKSNTTLKETLNEIETQTDYLFIYSNKVNVNQDISIGMRKGRQVPLNVSKRFWAELQPKMKSDFGTTVMYWSIMEIPNGM